MDKLRGTGVAMVTPFSSDGDVDYQALKKLTEHLAGNGVNYLVVMGTTGENPTITDFEQQRILEIIIEVNENRVPVVFGIGGNNTAAMAARIKGFDFTGVTAVLMASPYYNKPNQNGLLNHYNQMADLCPVPIILYNVPGRTGSMMHADTILELAQHTNIAAVKEASGNFEHVMHLIKHKPENFLIISGDDNYTLPFVAAGMVGVISVIANAYPKDFSQMVRYSLESNFENARYLHYKLLPLMQAIFEDGNPGGIKVILNQIGICENELRLPCAPVSAVLEAKIRALVY